MPPVADAGPDQIVETQSFVILSGGGTDSDGDIISFTWIKASGPDVNLDNAETSSTGFMAPSVVGTYDEAQTLTFQLIVIDDDGASSTDTVNIIVEPIPPENSPPEADAGPDQANITGSITLNGSARDIDSDSSAFSYLWTEDGSTLSTEASFSKNDFSIGIHTLIFTVTDGEGASGSDSVVIVVRAPEEGTGTLNDTGIKFGGNYPSGNNVTCIGETISQQDCSGGRDSTHSDNSDGLAGFSFTKLDSTGNSLSSSAVEWDCVKDNVTGLIWEVKRGGDGIIGNEGEHDSDDRYVWYSTNSSSNGGDGGYSDYEYQPKLCYGYDTNTPSEHCNTEAFVARVNAASYCGKSDWRLPSNTELLGLVAYDRISPAIDTNHFPFASWDVYTWSNTPQAHHVQGEQITFVKTVHFDYGIALFGEMEDGMAVRLVSSGN